MVACVFKSSISNFVSILENADVTQVRVVGGDGLGPSYFDVGSLVTFLFLVL
jgi:hypothetical protein